MNILKPKIYIIIKFIILLIITFYQPINAQNVDLNKYELEATFDYEFIDYYVEGADGNFDGIKDDLSGITYNKETNTLFMVQNDPENIYEVNLEGIILRMIKLDDFYDTEGIVHISGNRFAVTEERLGKVVFINIDANTTRIDYNDADKAQLPSSLTPTDRISNDGLEGLTYNAATNEIITTREYKGRKGQTKGYFTFEVPSSFPAELSMNQVRIVCEANNSGLTQLRDLAGIYYTGENMLVLSEGEVNEDRQPEERQLIEVNSNCEEVSKLSLSDKEQTEGVTMTDDGTLFIASEKHYLYKFVKKLDCIVGQPCDDNDVCTINDVYDDNCNCKGLYEDKDDDGICDAEDDCVPGTLGNGDVNLDGVSNIVDALLITQYEVDNIIAGDCENLNMPGELCIAQADMNCDGFINVVDALLIASCEVGIEAVKQYCPN